MSLTESRPKVVPSPIPSAFTPAEAQNNACAECQTHANPRRYTCVACGSTESALSLILGNVEPLGAQRADKLAHYITKQIGTNVVKYAANVVQRNLGSLLELSYNEGKAVLDAAKAVSA